MELYPLKNTLSNYLKKYDYNYANLSSFISYIDNLKIKYDNNILIITILNNFKRMVESPSKNTIICLEDYVSNITDENILIDLISYFDIQLVNQMTIIRQQKIILDELNRQSQLIQQIQDDFKRSKKYGTI